MSCGDENMSVLDWLNEKISLRNVCIILLLVTVAVFIWLNAVYVNDIVAGAHGFRQAQTALSSLYLQINGFKFAYETPVIGEKWAIPFEFPLYQYIVAIISSKLKIDLVYAGKFFSAIIFLPSVFLLCKILKDHQVDRYALCYGAVLSLSAPLYLYWSGTFMIETAALLLTICFLYFFNKIFIGERLYKNYIFAAFFLTLALLQKSTTTLPILPLLAISLWLYKIPVCEIKKNSIKAFNNILFILGPLLIGYLWVVFTDSIKSENPIGIRLTSAALSSWNFGSLDLRLSSSFWYETIFKRLIYNNCNSIIGLLSISTYLMFGKNSNVKSVLLFLIALFVLPLLVFTNLHFRHDYYQSSNLIYLTFAVGISVYYIALEFFGKNYLLKAFLLLSLPLYNYYIYKEIYMPYKINGYSNSDEQKLIRRTLTVSDYIKENSLSDQPIIVYGYDWSSEIAFYSRRRSLTLPWGDWDVDAITNTNKYLPSMAPSLIVNCPNKNFDEINRLVKAKYTLSTSDFVYDCIIHKNIH